MKILICGMPRSMTTWAFNVVRELLAPQKLRTLWIAPNDGAADAEFVGSADHVLAKCHHYSDRLEGAADFVLYSFRDVRSAAVSYLRKFESTCTTGQIEAWVYAGRRWTGIADICLRYEYVHEHPLTAIAQIRQALVTRFGEQSVSSDDDEDVLRRIDTAFAARQALEKIDYDVETMILPQHRTYQPSPEQLSEIELALYNRVENEFASWLIEHGYLSRDSYGQDTDYQLAEKLLRNETAPLVVDIGVERGSFTQLALDCGARHVIGFEALPRHVEFLRQRFGRDSRVSIYDCAVSSRTGRAAFHIAIDNEGRELDYHHTLSDLSESATVKRSVKTIEVETVTLSDLLRRGDLSSGIAFLKIDTDGHDLEVLQGLGELRPRYVSAEFWDNLPETSGHSPYKLADLAEWADKHGYSNAVLVRRHGAMESLEWNAFWSEPGDRGHVLFVHSTADMRLVSAALAELAPLAQVKNRRYVTTLLEDIESKEAEIRRLDNENRQLRQQLTLNPALTTKSRPAENVEAQDCPPSVQDEQGSLQLELISKERVIQEQKLALTAYRSAFALLWPVLKPLNFSTRLLGAIARPKLGKLHQHPPRDLEMPAPFVSSLQAMELPSISIVTPSFNQAAFVGRTIESVLSQNYPKLEYVVQDGGSDDGTVDILRHNSDRLSTWESKKDSGQSSAINCGFAKTTGEVMGWLNSDDLLAPGCLAYVGDYFARHPDVDVVYGHRIVVDEKDKEIGRWILPRHNDAVLKWADFIPQETLFWRRSIWDRAGGCIDESFRFAMDWDLLLRFRALGAKMVRLPRFLGVFRVHENQKTSALINGVGAQEMDRLRLRELGKIPSRGEIARLLMPFLLSHLAADISWRLINRLRRLS